MEYLTRAIAMQLYIVIALKCAVYFAFNNGEMCSRDITVLLQRQRHGSKSLVELVYNLLKHLQALCLKFVLSVFIQC